MQFPISLSFLTRTENGCFLGQFLFKSSQIKYYCVEFVKTNILRPSLLNLEFQSKSYEFCKFPFLIAISVIHYLVQLFSQNHVPQNLYSCRSHCPQHVSFWIIQFGQFFIKLWPFQFSVWSYDLNLHNFYLTEND